MQDNNTDSAAEKADLVLIGSAIIPLRCASAGLSFWGLMGILWAPAGGPLPGRPRPPLQRKLPRLDGGSATHEDSSRLCCQV